jgi:hypothetical protein
MLQLKEALDTAPSDQPNYRKLDLNDRNWRDMEWIPKCSDEILKILEQVALLAFQPPPASAVMSVRSGLVRGLNRLNLDQMTRQEILDYNLKNDLGLLNRMDNVNLRTSRIQGNLLTVLAARLTAFSTLEMRRALDP